MIRFLFDAGSTATDRKLLQYIKNDIAAGKKVILLVPEQAAVSTERRMLTALPPTAQLAFEVLNFTRLANRTFRAVGGLGYRYATPGVSALLMWQTLRQLSPALRLYGERAGRDMHLCEKMLSVVAQCKAYLVSPDTLLQAADGMTDADPLGKKLFDIGSVYATYQHALTARFDDMDDDLTRAADLILKNPALYADTVLYVDGFSDFTGQETALLRVLFDRVPDAVLTLALSDEREDGIHLQSARHTFLSLWRMATECGQKPIFDVPKEERPACAADFIRRHLFDMRGEPAPLLMRENVSLVACPTPFAEAEYAAATIARLVREGYRYRDITVILRDASAAVGIIDAALEKEGIPYFLSERTDITLRPLIKFILFALRIRLFGWQSEDVIGYLKTGLLGLAADDINFFEEYAAVWRLRGAAVYAAPFTMNPDGYSEKISGRGKRILAAAERVREAIQPPLRALFESLDTAENTAAYCAALDAFLRGSDIPARLQEETAARLAAGERREAEELSRLWGVVVGALEEIATTLGEEEVTLREFYDMLRLSFAATDMGTIPTSADEVMIGSASTLRADRTRFAIVLGLNEGNFPAKVGDKGPISDTEKKQLEKLGIILSGDGEMAASDELFYVRRALSLPTEKLFLSYAEADTEGRKAEPSIAVTRIQKLFAIEKATPLSALPLSDRLFSLDTAIDRLPDLAPGQRMALLSLLSEKPETAKTAKRLCMPVVDANAAIKATEAAALFKNNTLNPTGLESFVGCRFAYYCNHILRLRKPEDDAIGADIVGNFMHHVLEHVLTDSGKGEKEWQAHTADQTEALVTATVADYRQRLIHASGGLSPRAEALLTRLGTLARLVVASLFEELADSRFSPAFFELDLSKEGHAVTRLSDGSELRLSGKVDRADVYTAPDGQTYLRIVDYKTGSRHISPADVAEGTCLQMPLYLHALCRGQHQTLCRRLGLPPDTVFKPAAVSYFSSNVGSENTPGMIPEHEALAAAQRRVVRESLLLNDPDVLAAMSVSGDPGMLGAKSSLLTAEEFEGMLDTLTETVGKIQKDMHSGTAAAHPRVTADRSPCNFCAFGPVCRNRQRSK